ARQSSAGSRRGRPAVGPSLQRASAALAQAAGPTPPWVNFWATAQKLPLTDCQIRGLWDQTPVPKPEAPAKERRPSLALQACEVLYQSPNATQTPFSPDYRVQAISLCPPASFRSPITQVATPRHSRCISTRCLVGKQKGQA